MRKKILITSFDMAIGGVERSLIGLLSSIDYSIYDVDLLLYKHEGEFLPMLPQGPKLLEEIKQYTTFRKPIRQVVEEGNLPIAITRLMAKYIGTVHGKMLKSQETGYMEIQYGWALSRQFLPKLQEEYDLAISFLWPHYVVGEKVQAKRKVGWIHTDYATIAINRSIDLKMWDKMDKIVAVSESCKDSFVQIFPSQSQKVEVIENIISPTFIHQQANVDISGEMPVKPERTKILTVGRLTHQKGIDDAVRACKSLLDQGYDIEWYVVGYGPLEKEIKELINELGVQDRFILLGKKINPYPYMKACDIYAQPSRYEGKAVTVREAQILGKPVLLTNFPTAKSQAKDGFDAIIVPSESDGIVEGIIKLINDKQLRNKLAENTLTMDYGNHNEIEKFYQLV